MAQRWSHVASLSFAGRNQAQSGSVACQRGDALAGAVPTESDTAARIPSEVIISSAKNPDILLRIAPMSWVKPALPASMIAVR